ncbi:MAG: DUF1266 domain-containing protein, partial [Helicobacteraceae bacterium]|nr:DUF1266 domain-containing protein [Helicobacteraceae bacterium]
MSAGLLALGCLAASVAVYLCFFSLGSRRFVKRLTNSEFKANPNAPQIDAKLAEALTIGLIYAEEIGAFADGMATGLSAERLETELKKWGVSDKASAVSTMNWLIQSGDRASYGAILSFVLRYNKREARREAIKAEYKENARAFIECADRLARAIVNRRKPPFAIDEKSLKKGVLAWDAG